MLQLTPENTNELLNLINRNQNIAVAKEFGPEFLTEYDKSLLSDYGVKVDELYQLENDTVFTSFSFGLLSDSLEAIHILENLSS